MPVTLLPNGNVRIPLDEIGTYLAENRLEITGQVGAQRALVFELAPVEDNLPPAIPPAWFGLDAPTRDANLATIGYRVVGERICRNGTRIYELDSIGA